jgi:hypothetical protein
LGIGVVIHACNLNYWGSREWENCGSLSAKAKSQQDSISTYKMLGTAGHWRLRPVILATKEAEIRRITVQSQPRQTVRKTLSKKKNPSQKRAVEWLNV